MAEIIVIHVRVSMAANIDEVELIQASKMFFVSFIFSCRLSVVRTACVSGRHDDACEKRLLGNRDLLWLQPPRRPLTQAVLTPSLGFFRARPADREK